MSIMSKNATYAKDLKFGNIYSGLGGMGEVQIDKEGNIWFYNKNDFNYMGCPAKSIMKINPDKDSLFYFIKKIEGDIK